MEVSQQLKENIVRKCKRKERIDLIVKSIFLFIAIVCASVVIFIIIFILIKGIYPFINNYSTDPNVVIRQDFSQFFINSNWLYNGQGGMFFLLLTTLYTTLLSLIISVPLSIFTALFVSRIAPKILKVSLREVVNILAAIPSVIFGLFGKGVICPIVFNVIPIQTAGGQSILSAVIILALMTVPTMTTLAIDAMEAVSPSLNDASIALGASKAQTNMKIIVRSAQSGIFAGIILGIGRALGEATAVQMVIGGGSNGTGFLDIFNIGSTLTSAMLSGIGEASGIGYDVRFSLGIVLMLVILIINFLLNFIKNRMGKINKKPSKHYIKKIFNKVIDECKDLIMKAKIYVKIKK